ncbi:MAG: SapC family protein [Pseudomonadota bacterium]
MVRKRAVAADEVSLPGIKLPPLYSMLTPLTPERHEGLRLRPMRDFGHAAGLNAVPLTADEFPRAMRDYPIVLAGGSGHMPVALVGLTTGRNDQVDEGGAWAEGRYVPAYLRRYPFMLVREGEGSDRSILCADVTSTLFTEDPEEGQPLFEDGAAGPALSRILDFCTRYETAMARTRAVMADATALDLVQPSRVEVNRDGRTGRIEGFALVAEERVRALPDDKLADLARRGVLSLFAAHQMSLSNFTGFGA